MSADMSPDARAGGRNRDPAKAIIPWLSIISLGRVRLVARLSMKAPAARRQSAATWMPASRPEKCYSHQAARALQKDGA